GRARRVVEPAGATREGNGARSGRRRSECGHVGPEELIAIGGGQDYHGLHRAIRVDDRILARSEPAQMRSVALPSSGHMNTIRFRCGARKHLIDVSFDWHRMIARGRGESKSPGWR